ncbi:hypothetical protein Salat_1623900 [Sesamum alatum]|uniref:Uncharacterized protein n=1 Tax=Sesamum alatum TaxID=300844 RepID=A0AAE1Y652_9LAMI|nr:hypothetical protein Salat_1623900 [Sesamum alatum]
MSNLHRSVSDNNGSVDSSTSKQCPSSTDNVWVQLCLCGNSIVTKTSWTNSNPGRRFRGYSGQNVAQRWLQRIPLPPDPHPAHVSQSISDRQAFMTPTELASHSPIPQQSTGSPPSPAKSATQPSLPESTIHYFTHTGHHKLSANNDSKYDNGGGWWRITTGKNSGDIPNDSAESRQNDKTMHTWRHVSRNMYK